VIVAITRVTDVMKKGKILEETNKGLVSEKISMENQLKDSEEKFWRFGSIPPPSTIPPPSSAIPPPSTIPHLQYILHHPLYLLWYLVWINCLSGNFLLHNKSFIFWKSSTSFFKFFIIKFPSVMKNWPARDHLF